MGIVDAFQIGSDDVGMGEGKIGHPVPWMRLTWPGGTPIGEKPR